MNCSSSCNNEDCASSSTNEMVSFLKEVSSFNEMRRSHRKLFEVKRGPGKYPRHDCTCKHAKSKKHKSEETKSQKDNNECKIEKVYEVYTVEDNSSNDTEPLFIYDRSNSSLYGSYHCETCSVTLNSFSTYNSHVNGKKHLKNLKKKNPEDIAKNISSFSTEDQKNYPSAPEGVLRTRVKIRAKLQDMLERQIRIPCPGLSFITEIQGIKEILYYCSMCDKVRSRKRIIEHLTSFKHRMKLLKYIKPDIYKYFKTKPRTKVNKKMTKILTYVESQEVNKGKIIVERDILAAKPRSWNNEFKSNDQSTSRDDGRYTNRSDGQSTSRASNQYTKKYGERSAWGSFDRYTNKGGNQCTDRGGDRYTNRGGDRYTNRNDDRYTNRDGDRYTNRGGDRYTNRVGDRYTNRGGDRYTNRGGNRYSNRRDSQYTNRDVGRCTNGGSNQSTNRDCNQSTSEIEAVQSTSYQSSDLPFEEKYKINATPDTSHSDFYCQVCYSHMNSQSMWEMHIVGKRHINNLKKSPGIPPSKTKTIAIPNAKAHLLERLEAEDVCGPIVGLDKIQEIQNPDLQTNQYQCFLCGACLSSVEIINHILTMKHRQKYLNHIEFPGRETVDCMREQAANILIEEMCSQVEAAEGRGNPSVHVSKSAINNIKY